MQFRLTGVVLVSSLHTRSRLDGGFGVKGRGTGREITWE